MSLRISKPSSYNINYNQTDPILNPSGFVAQNNVVNVSFRKSAYGQGKWIIVSSRTTNPPNNGEFISSTDSVNWTGVFGGQDPSGNYVFYDPSSNDLSANYCQYTDIAYGNNMWVAVSIMGWPTRAVSSPDGIKWTRRDTSGGATSAGSATSLQGIRYSQGQFVTIGQNTGNNSIPKIYTSPDGITWTGRTIYQTDLTTPDPIATVNLWRDLEYGNNIWVGVAATSASSSKKVIISTDSTATKWYSPVLDASSSAMNTKNWERIAFGNGIFVAVSSTAVSDCIATSPNGINWTLRTSPIQGNLYSIGFGNGIFIAASYIGVPGNRVMSSPDGINWTIIKTSVENQFYGVSYANNTWLINSDNGTNNRVSTLNYASYPSVTFIQRKYRKSKKI